MILVLGEVSVDTERRNVHNQLMVENYEEVQGG